MKRFLKIMEQTKCYCGHTTNCDCGPEEYYNQEDLGADWRKIEDEVPQYYGLNLCYGNNSMAVCWRASDGDHDIYTIAGTDNIMQNISHWMPLPSKPICN